MDWFGERMGKMNRIEIAIECVLFNMKAFPQNLIKLMGMNYLKAQENGLKV